MIWPTSDILTSDFDTLTSLNLEDHTLWCDPGYPRTRRYAHVAVAWVTMSMTTCVDDRFSIDCGELQSTQYVQLAFSRSFAIANVSLLLSTLK